MVLSCDDINECSSDYPTRVCDMNADCINSYGGYDCRCKPGFYGPGTPGNCYGNEFIKYNFIPH